MEDKTLIIDFSSYRRCYEDTKAIMLSSPSPELRQKKSRLDKVYRQLYKSKDSELQEFHSIIHEIKVYDYIANTLNFEINVFRDDKPGPDFNTAIGYIECVQITKGTSANRAKVNSILDNDFNRFESTIPRFTSVLHDKLEKFKIYLKEKIIMTERPRLIAITPGSFGSDINTLGIEIALQRVLYGIGYQKLQTDSGISSVEYTKIVNYKHKSSSEKFIELDLLSKSDYSIISGVIYTSVSLGEKLSFKNVKLYINSNAIHPIALSFYEFFETFHLVSDEDGFLTYKVSNGK